MQSFLVGVDAIGYQHLFQHHQRLVVDVVQQGSRHLVALRHGPAQGPGRPALGQVERERVQLVSKDDENSISAAEISRLRYRWSQVTNAILTNLDLAGDSVDEETRIRILQPLQNAEKKQEQARRRKNKSSVEEELVLELQTELDAPLDTEDEPEDDSPTGTSE